MSLNSTPSAERTHIALFGSRNAGKSSLINALTSQDLAIVSPVKGTTTDPVYKSIEILPLGPCVLIDTAGLDDVGELGELRKKKTLAVLDKTDIALIVLDATVPPSDYDREIIRLVKSKKLPLLGLLNKIDCCPDYRSRLATLAETLQIKLLPVSAVSQSGIQEAKTALAELQPESTDARPLVGDLVEPGKPVVLVTPIDSAAPKGRLILPQQQVLRDLLDHGIPAVVCRETELKAALVALCCPPQLVICDSQAFQQVDAETPPEVPLTSFSILFARYKGDLAELVKGAEAVEQLRDGDRILISEGCTHHRQADDIGTVKIPRWLKQVTGKELIFDHSSGVSFSEQIKQYRLIIHCGGCMLNRQAMQSRIRQAAENQVPIVNYGVLIAYLKGILPRALKPVLNRDNRR
ncbi:[FeFe] hydrogenase H-cluster maturation GTPase HydF [Victivallis sp. Marseille-Q1083]|uniref:[FeFe] hydrogenase H-cluster maturation GTPase HydF n=1 Tax=Victivallis sp. Marseille-Q1083 TaxID=2717288 RepID=UPI00158D2F21|nr:[FeFe] hydrogenase H-cluster maturation GTPase HydF [Victivallis sp. Marseille-Q1083]